MIINTHPPPNTFHKNPSSGSRTVPCGWAETTNVVNVVKLMLLFTTLRTCIMCFVML